MIAKNHSATIEATVDNLLEAVLKAGFEPGQRVRINVEYVDEAESSPFGFALIERDGERMLSGVTLETLPHALKMLGIGPEETFSLIVCRDADSSGFADPVDRGA